MAHPAQLAELEVVRERLARYDQTGEHIPYEDMRAWLLSLGTGHELPRPKVDVEERVAAGLKDT